MKKVPIFATCLGAFLGLVIGALFLWPLVESVRGAFFDPEGGFTLAYLGAVFENPVYVEGFVNSLAIACATTVVTALIGIPLTLLFQRAEFPGRSWLQHLVPLPLFVPPFVGALGIQRLLGPTGAVNELLDRLGLVSPGSEIDWLRDGRFWAVVGLTSLHLFPVLYFNLSAALASQSPELERAAELLGARPLRKLLRVTLPLAAPGLFAALTIIFIASLTELGVPLLCDYGRVTSVQIFAGLKDISQNPFVFALVTVTLLATVSLYALSRYFLGKPPKPGAGLKGYASRVRQPLKGYQAALATSFALAVLGAAALPNVSVILLASSPDWYGTILPSSFSTEHFRAALGHALVVPSIANSLRYVLLATGIDLVLGFSVAWVVARTNAPGRRVLDALSMLPLLLPGLVLAFGYLAISRPGRPFDFIDPTIDPTPLLVIAYSMRRLPFIVRSTEAGLLQIGDSVEEAARSLGANGWRVVRRVTLPLVTPHLLAGALFAFALSMLEVSDSLVLAQKSEYFPITKAIYELSQLIGDGRLVAAALGTWAMFLLAMTLWVARRLALRHVGRQKSQ